jgi:hypothetical protein
MTTFLPPRAKSPADPAVGTTRWGWAAAGSVTVAGALHVAAAADHLDAGDVVVGFFLVVAFMQLAVGAWLAVSATTRVGFAPWPVAAALSVTVALLLLYLAVHTTDLLAGIIGPDHHGGATTGTHIGEHGRAAEPKGPVALGLEPTQTGGAPGLLGTGTVAVELISVLALTALLPAVLRRHAANGLLGLGVLVWLAWVTGVFG